MLSSSLSSQNRRFETAQVLLVCLSLFLVLIVLSVFWQVVHAEFIVTDDSIYIYQNPHIQQGLTWPGVVWAFTADLFNDSPQTDYWQPITILSRMIDIQWFGLNPTGHHTVNLLFHTLNALLLFFLLSRTTHNIFLSAFVACIFAVHPIQISPVAWVTARKDLLAIFFGLMSLWAYCDYAQQPIVRRRLLSLLCYGLSLMSKPALLCFPFILIVLDYWPLQRVHENSNKKIWLSLFREKWTFFVLALLSFLISRYGASPETFVSMKTPMMLLIRILHIPVSYTWYIQKVFYPINIPVFHLHEQFTWVEVGASCIFLFSWSCAVFLMRKSKPALLMGWTWFLFALAPGSIAVVENRFMYFPIVGLLIMSSWGAFDLVQNQNLRRIYLAPLASLLILTCSILSWREVGYWQDSISLFRRTLELEPTRRIKHLLGISLLQKKRFDEGLPYLEDLLKGVPADDAAVFNDIASLLYDFGRPEDSIKYYLRAIQIMPTYARGYNNLGYTLANFHRYGEAVYFYKKALETQPDFPEAHFNLAKTYEDLGKNEDAIRHYNASNDLWPNYDACYAIGLIKAKERNYADAEDHFRKALSLNPKHAESLFALGNVELLKGKIEEAIAYYRRSLILKSDSASTHYNLGNAFFRIKSFEEAKQHYREAIQLNPDYEDARKNLAKIESLTVTASENIKTQKN